VGNAHHEFIDGQCPPYQLNPAERNFQVPSETLSPSISKGRLWTGRVISVLLALLLAMDGVMKLVQPDFVVKETVRMGYPENVILPMGVVLLVSIILYLVPRTAVLGAILLTGYLGGAVATHVRHEDGLFAIFFPAIYGALLWLALVLRDNQLSSLIPVRQER
jgi:hypothetical protein